jgi:hypothetical protein
VSVVAKGKDGEPEDGEGAAVEMGGLLRGQEKAEVEEEEVEEEEEEETCKGGRKRKGDLETSEAKPKKACVCYIFLNLMI